MHKIIVIVLILLISGCTLERSEMEFQKEVMDEIFVALVDSLHFDYRIPLRPPPPTPPGFEKNDSAIRARNSIRVSWIKEYHRKLDSIRKDTSKLNIAIRDTIYEGRKYLFDELKSRKDKQQEWDTLTAYTDYRIDLSNFQDNEIFRFIYVSKLPADLNQWYDLKVYESIAFSTIVFDKSKTKGVMNGWISCGKGCSSGFLAFVKKENNKWLIDRIEPTWVT